MISIIYRERSFAHPKFARGAPMGSQNLLALTSKRAEVSECIRLLEERSGARSGLAVARLLARLRQKGEWLDRRIQLELEQTDPAKTAAFTDLSRNRDAA
jgi:hypothetical protein